MENAFENIGRVDLQEITEVSPTRTGTAMEENVQVNVVELYSVMVV